jgi:hypothetical protein
MLSLTFKTKRILFLLGPAFVLTALVFVTRMFSQIPLTSVDWTQQFGTTGPSTENTYNVAVDSSGNVYMVGDTNGTLTSADGAPLANAGGTDAIVRKYDASGTEQWTRQFGSTSLFPDRAVGVALDNTGVYVVGTAAELPGFPFQGTRDAYLRKYSFSGTELWTQVFGTPATDIAFGVASDGTSVYVGGQTDGTFPGQTNVGGNDAFLMKFDTSGNAQWTVEFGTGGDEVINNLVLLGGEIYVAGNVNGPLQPPWAGGTDAFVRKYNASGVALWTRQFGGPSFDGALGITADATGVYVTGQNNVVLISADGVPQVGNGGGDSYVRKYNSSGTEQWTRQFGTPAVDIARGIHADASGIYVVGTTAGVFSGQSNAGGIDSFVRKIDASGNHLLTIEFGTSGTDQANGVVVNAAGAYVAGLTNGSLPGQINAGGQDVFLRNYALNLVEAWTRQFGAPFINLQESGHAVTVDSNGNGYVAGSTAGSLTSADGASLPLPAGGTDGFIRKYDPTGTELWTRRYGTTATEALRALASDGSSVYAGGTTSGPPSNVLATDGHVRKYDSLGGLAWSTSFGSTATNSLEFVNGISVDASAVYVVGTTDGDLGVSGANLGGWDVFLRRYDLSGSLQWSRQLGTSASDFGDAVSADASGIYLIGQTDGTFTSADGVPLANPGGQAIFVRKYDPSGNEIWTRQFNITTTFDPFPVGLSANANGVFIAGKTTLALPGQTALGGLDAFVRKYDFLGNVVWTDQFGGTGDDYGSAVTVGPAGVIVGGRIGNAGIPDAFVRGYTFDGESLWTHQLTTPTSNQTNAVAVRGSHVYAAGNADGGDVFLGHITLQDSDGDGVQDAIQTAPGFFADTHVPTATTGHIIDRGGLQVFVADSVNSAKGVEITVGSGTGSAQFQICNTTFELDAGSTAKVTCHSLGLEVVQGAAEVKLDEGETTVDLPAGTEVNIHENAGDNSVELISGEITVESTAAGDATKVLLDGGDTIVELSPGSEAGITESPSGTNTVNLISGGVTVESEGTASTQIVLEGGEKTVEVPPGGGAGVTENPDGTSSIENLGDAGDPPLTVTSGDTSTNVPPGGEVQTGGVFIGFSIPVSNTDLNKVQAGSVVPLRWRLTKPDGTPIVNLTSVSVVANTVPCEGGVASNDVAPVNAVGSGLQNLADGYYQYNWKTSKSEAGACKHLQLSIDAWVVSKSAEFFLK